MIATAKKVSNLFEMPKPVPHGSGEQLFIHKIAKHLDIYIISWYDIKCMIIPCWTLMRITVENMDHRRCNMNKNKRGMKKLWPALLATILLTLVMVCTILPAGAYEMTSGMLKDLQGFFETHEDLELSNDTLAAFVKDYLYEKNANDPEHFSDEDMAELESLLTQDGEADYMILTALLLVDTEHPDVNVALDALEKVASAQQLIAFVEAQMAYAAGVEADTYRVIWQANGVSVEDSYRHMDVYGYPTKAELGLVSGEFVRWNTGAFFEAPATKDEPVIITGTVSNLASELTDISDGITDVNQVFHAEIDEENHRVVLALDVHPSNYMEVLSSLMNFSSDSALKAEIKAMLYDIVAAGINAGVNRLSINGHELLTVDSYAVDDLIDLLDLVAEGHVGGLISVDSVEALIRSEDYTMHRFTNMTPVTVDGVTYQSFGDYRVKLATDGLDSAEWTVSLAFDGDTSDIVQIAKWMEEAVTVTDITGGKNVRIDLTDDKMQFILEQAYKALEDKAAFNQLVTRHGNLEDGYFFVISADATVAQMKELILKCDFAELLSLITGKNAEIADSIHLKKLMALVLDQIPARLNDRTIGSLYDGDHGFNFDATFEKDYFRALAQRVLGDYSFWIGGHELVMSDVIDHVFDRIDFVDIYVQVDIYMGDYRLYYVQNGDNVEGVFARPGTELSAIFDAVAPKDGYDIVYFFNGEEITVAPDEDVMDDTNPITYDYRVREHSLTVDVLFTDAVTGQETTQSVTLSVAYGTVIDEAFLRTALADAGIVTDGYTVTFPAATVMPDSALSLTVAGERIYFTVTWMVDGVLYGETLVAWGEIPVIDAPEKASDINFHYTFKDWGLVLVPIYADATYEAVFTPSSRYDDTVNDNAAIGKDEDNNNITVDVGGVDGEGTPEITIPLGPIIEDLKKDPAQGLDYDHNFGDGYDLELDVSPEAMQEIIRQLEEILEEKGATLDDVTIHTSREETTTENGDPAVKYEIIIEVEGEPVDIRVEDGITVRVNADDPADPEKEIVVYYKDPATGEMIELDSEVIGTDENGKLVIEFEIPGFGEIYVVEETKTYPTTGGTSTPECGDVEISPENAAAGETVTVTVTPAEGYEIDKVIITDKDGNTFEATRDPENENIFTYEQPSGGSTVEVIFKVAEYDVVFKFYNANGEAVSVTVTVKHGSLATAPDTFDWMSESHSYTFAYWDCGDGMDYAELDGVFSDMTVEAVYDQVIRSFTVIFEYYDENGVWTKVEYTFEYGQNAVAPQIPQKVVTLYTTYEFDGWDQALIPVTQNLTFRAQYTPSQNYTGENGETVEKGEDSLDITVNNGTDTSEIPFSPILSEIENGLDVPLNYTHIFADGYYLEVIFSETAEDHARLLAAIEAALTEAGLPLDSPVTLYTARSLMTPEELRSVLTPEQIEALFGNDRINAVYKYEISFKVGDTVLSVNGLENNLHRVNVNYDPDSDSQFKVVTDQGEELDSELTPGGDKGGEVEFSTPHYSSFFVVDYSEVYVVTDGTNEHVTIVVDPTSGVKDTVITVTATPAEDYHLVRLYYVFNGQEVTITNGQFTLPGDVEIKAELKKIHTVTFVGFDGSIIDTVRVIDGEAASAPTAPAVVGYSFDTWDTTFSNVTSDLTVTAIYEINQYTISFNSNGGSAVESIKQDYNTAVTAPADPTKIGYTFAGWYSDEALTQAYTFDKMPAEDITLYAKWTINQYTIIFKDYDGTELKKETLDYGAAIVAPADPTRAPSFDTIYRFNGWNPEVAATVTGDATYTATYTESPRNNNEDVEIEQKPDGSIEVGGNAKDPENDGKEEVEIPGGPILDGMEDDLDQPINININFGGNHFLKAVILPEDQAEIMKQLKAILEAQGLTNDDVKIVISREAVTLDGKSAYLYELSFKVGNMLVSLEGKGANTITVSAPVADGMDAGFEVYLKNMSGEYELITADCTAENGIASVSFSIKYYTAFRVKDVSTVVTQVPGVVETDTEAETEPSGCDGSNAWWIILLVVVLLVVLGLVGFVLYQKGILFKQIQKTMDESAEDESTSGAPLFIPLGEELPEEELEEIHIVSEVSVEDVDKMMSDYTAEHILEESDKAGGLGKLGIINVGALHNEFEDGDTVNLEVLKEKDMIADSIGRLKVLASGSLDKALTVEADAFSVQAIKMITLTGGHAVKLRTNTEGAAQNQKKRKK